MWRLGESMTPLYGRCLGAVLAGTLALLGSTDGSSRSQAGDMPPLLETSSDISALFPQAQVVTPGTSSRQVRQEAIAALHLEGLSPQQRQQADSVLGSLSLYRRLTIYSCQVDPRVHDFFTQHPDVAVSIWRAMGISSMEMRQTGPHEYEIETTDGTQGTVTRLKQGRDSNLIVCSGLFKSPYLAKPIESRALMHLHSVFSKDAQGHSMVTYQADLFVSFPSQGVETVAKLISPVSNVIMDRNFEEITLFLQVMGTAMCLQPGWTEQLAQRLEGILPGRSDQLLKLAAAMYVDHQVLRRQQQGGSVSLDEIRPPVIPTSAIQPASR